MRVKSLLKSLLCSYFVTGIFLVLLAFLLYKLDLQESVVGMGIAVVYIFSCFLGGFLLGRRVGSKKYLWGLLLGMCYFVLLVGVSWISEKQIAMSVPHALTTLGMCLAGGALGGMLS
ncbi:MAG: TIGR04086 family membrane protein [Blautia sp.]|jgi:putative membrane protein (TIGR04086 family)